MFKNNHQLIFSPTDLTTYMASPFASWMDRLQNERPNLVLQVDEADPLISTLQAKGIKHEQAMLKIFEAQGLTITKIATDNKFSDTVTAMEKGVDIIYQAALRKLPFQGFADFLVKTTTPSALGNYSYEVWDTKLSKDLKPEYVIQLCCYSEMHQIIQDVLPKYIVVVPGRDVKLRLKLSD